MVVKAWELRLCIIVELFCSQVPNIAPHISLHDFPCWTMGTCLRRVSLNKVVFLLLLRRSWIQTYFCNCPQYLCSFRTPVECNPNVKSTSPVTENHYKNGYLNYNIYKNFIMTNVDINSDTKYTVNNDTNNHDTRNLAICTSEHSSAPLVVFLVLMMCHTTLAQVHRVFHLTSSACRTCVVVFDSLRPPSLLQPVLPRLLPLLCPDVP